MALITAQAIVMTGLAPAYATPTSSDTVVGGDNVFLHVKNGAGSPINVTIVRQVASNYGELNNVVVAVPNGGERMLGPLNAAQGFIATATNLVTINYSSTTSITSGAFLF